MTIYDKFHNRMPDVKKILSSIKINNKLNPKFWDSSNNFDPKIREKLLDIAYEFIDFLGIDIVVSDIVLTGSLANYNWSRYSDIDLHVIVNFEQFKESQIELFDELFNLKKLIYNQNHDIEIYGFDVELYVQNESESHFSTGVYSILFDKWINEPKKQKVIIDKELIKAKANKWMEMIDSVIENYNDVPIDEFKKIIKTYKDKLKKYRSSGLEKNGEFSIENMVFKVLRRSGHIKKLYDFENSQIDKKLSVK